MSSTLFSSSTSQTTRLLPRLPHRWRGLDFFPTSYAATGNQTHVSSVAPLLRDLKPVVNAKKLLQACIYKSENTGLFLMASVAISIV